MPKTTTRVRRVYLNFGEVINPTQSPVDVTRGDIWTLFTVHPGTSLSQGIPRVAEHIHNDETSAWADPWLDTVNLEELRTNPLRILEREAPHILYLPPEPHIIPQQQRPPWEN